MGMKNLWVIRACDPKTKSGAILACDGPDPDKFRVAYRYCESLEALEILGDDFDGPQNLSVANILKYAYTTGVEKPMPPERMHVFVAMELLRHFINRKNDPSWVIPDCFVCA